MHIVNYSKTTKKIVNTLCKQTNKFKLKREYYGRRCLTQLSTQLTQLNEHVWTQVLKHLNVHIYLVTIAYRYYNQLISVVDSSQVGRKIIITSWCIQSLSKRVLNRQTVSTSTTKLGRLLQILTIRAVKEYFRVS